MRSNCPSANITKKESWHWDQDYPSRIPYELLSEHDISSIINERQVWIRSDKVKELTKLDEIWPDWFNALKDIRSYSQLKSVPDYKIRTIAALYGYDPKKRSLDGKNFTRMISILHFGEWYLINNADTVLLSYLVEILGLFPEPKVLDRKELIGILKGEELEEECVEARIIRYRRLLGCNEERLLLSLYDAEDLGRVAQLRPHPLEEFILSLDKAHPHETANMCGMVIPFGPNSLDYVRDNILSYKNIHFRDELIPITLSVFAIASYSVIKRYMGTCTDYQLFSVFGAYVPYSSREQLESRIMTLLRVPSFFLPQEASLKYCTNKTTIMGTSITDKNELLIAYGTIYSYRIYEPDDFSGAFSIRFDGIPRPENTDSLFPTSDISRLLQLTSFCAVNNSSLITLENEILKRLSIIENGDDCSALLALHHSGSSETRHKFRAILSDLFDLGLYFRRWKGPGYPWPLSQEQTTVQIQPLLLASPLMYRLYQELESSSEMSALWNKLDAFRFANGKFIRLDKPLSNIFNLLYKGNYCIRTASAQLMHTSHRNLEILYGEGISNYGPSKVAEVS